MSAQSTTRGGGIGAFGLLGVLFVGLKLTHYIDWSWWWVTLPFWGGLALILAFALMIALVSGAIAAIDVWLQARRRRRFRRLWHSEDGE